MLKQSIQLQNHDKSLNGYKSIAEIERLVARGDVFRVTPKKTPRQIYRFFPPPPPASSSKESPCELTPTDLRCLVGMQAVDEARFERLEGYGLIPEGAVIKWHDTLSGDRIAYL